MGKSYVFTTIIRVVFLFLFFVKILFNNGFKSNKNRLDFRVLLNRGTPDISSKVVNKDYIVFKTIR